MVSNNIVTFKKIEIGIPNISFSFGSKGASNMGSNISISWRKKIDYLVQQIKYYIFNILDNVVELNWVMFVTILRCAESP